MGAKREPITINGRSIGIAILTAEQLFIGVIHFLVGLLLLVSSSAILSSALTYDVYTAVFGFLVSVFAWFIWRGKKAGWVGTVAVLVFVIVVDTLRVLNLPSIPGIPNFAPPTEITWSILVMIYMSTKNVRKKFGIS
ncbi:MAG: hypothetical protein ABSA79_10190 [Candidatus Bathyarchaeia archaeon]|jgi:hypothetical protein